MDYCVTVLQKLLLLSYNELTCGPGLPRNCTAQHNHSALGKNHNWASEASPTLGCSIEISRDIYLYIYMSVCLSWSKKA